MPDYTNVVAAERAKYGTPLGNENAWKVCNGTALEMRRQTGDLSWGLHRKGGTNWNGYSIDVVGYRVGGGGLLYDVLGDAENTGRPQFSQVSGTLDWGPPVGGGDPPPPPPGDLAARVAALESQMAVHEARFRDISAAAVG